MIATREVRLHHVPVWLSKRIHRRIGWRLNVYDAVKHTAAPTGFDCWLDHWGSIKQPDGSTAFVREP